jgi:hypothetical protein
MAIPAKFAIRERGPAPRGFAKIVNVAKRESWEQAGLFFHDELRDNRFTQAHATAAGYGQRKKRYTFRKLKEEGHTRPLEKSGETREAVRRYGTLRAVSTNRSSELRIAYPGARKFNFRHPKSTINMVIEFTTITLAESEKVARVFDRELDMRINSDNRPVTT